MFGLIFLAGLAVMVLALLAVAWIGFRISRALGLGNRASLFIGTVLSLAIVLSVNAPLVAEAHTFTHLCEHDTERSVRRVVSDVDAIQIRGDSGGLWQNPDDLRYPQVYGAPSTNREEDRLPVRYEVKVSRTQVSKRTSRIEQNVIDLADGSSLGTSRSYEFNGEVAGQGLPAIFVMPWWLPSLPFAPAGLRCPGSDASTFVRTVLVPKR